MVSRVLTVFYDIDVLDILDILYGNEWGRYEDKLLEFDRIVHCSPSSLEVPIYGNLRGLSRAAVDPPASDRASLAQIPSVNGKWHLEMKL